MAWYDKVIRGINSNSEYIITNTERSNAWLTIVWSIDADMTITVQWKCAEWWVDLEEWVFAIWSDPDKKIAFNSFIPLSAYRIVITDYVAGSIDLEFNFQ